MHMYDLDYYTQGQVQMLLSFLDGNKIIINVFFPVIYYGSCPENAHSSRHSEACSRNSCMKNKSLFFFPSSGGMGGSRADRPSVGIRQRGGGSDEQGLGSFWHVQQRFANRHFLKALKDITLKCSYG